MKQKSNTKAASKKHGQGKQAKSPRKEDKFPAEDLSPGSQDGDARRSTFGAGGGGSLRISKNRIHILVADNKTIKNCGIEPFPPPIKTPPKGESDYPHNASWGSLSPPSPQGSFKNLPKGFDPFPRIPPHIQVSTQPTARPAAGDASAGPTRVHLASSAAAIPSIAGPSRAATPAPSVLEEPPLTASSRAHSESWTANSGLSSREASPQQDVTPTAQHSESHGFSSSRQVDAPAAQVSTPRHSVPQNLDDLTPSKVKLNPKALPFFSPTNRANRSQAAGPTLAESPGRYPPDTPTQYASITRTTSPVIVRSPIYGRPSSTFTTGASYASILCRDASQQNNGPKKRKNKSGRGKSKSQETAPVAPRPSNNPGFSEWVAASVRPVDRSQTVPRENDENVGYELRNPSASHNQGRDGNTSHVRGG